MSPGNADWYADVTAPRYDIAAAKRQLASLHFTDRNHDCLLEDAEGAPVHFTVLTQKGNTSLKRGASVIRESLAHVGVRVDVVGLEVGALMQSVLSGNYDAAYFRLLTTDRDPALNADFWLSSGGAHVWNPEQRTPATGWESHIDGLMDRVDHTGHRAATRLVCGVQPIIGPLYLGCDFFTVLLGHIVDERGEQDARDAQALR